MYQLTTNGTSPNETTGLVVDSWKPLKKSGQVWTGLHKSEFGFFGFDFLIQIPEIGSLNSDFLNQISNSDFLNLISELEILKSGS